MFDTRAMAAAEPVAVGARDDEDRRARLQLVADRVAPLALARERTLPLLDPVAGLFPGGALRRGTVVAMEGVGATSLALAVAAGPSAAGAWTAVVGDPSFGLAAAAEAGIALERLLVIDAPDARSGAGVLAALIGSVDVVLAGPKARIRPAELRRLSARLRERGSVLLRLGPVDAQGVDVGLRIEATRWSGLGAGHGHLRVRRAVVRAQGRGAAARPRSAELLLPGPGGRVGMS